MNAHLLRHDTNYGNYKGTVEATADELIVDGRRVKVLQEKDPAKLPWKDLGIDIVVESSGVFADATKARGHIDAGARYVIISQPAKNEDKTIVLGVNEKEFDPEKHHIISNASCTTNGLAPVAKVLNDEFGIEKGFLTTIHSKTLSQRLLDTVASDPRDARAASENIVPSETGAARADGLGCRFHGESETRSHQRRGQRGVQARFRGTAQRNHGLHRGAARFERSEGRRAFDHRQRVGHDRSRQHGQDHFLVRQRVGLRVPPRRHHRVRRVEDARPDRRWPLTRARRSTSGPSGTPTSAESASSCASTSTYRLKKARSLTTPGFVPRSRLSAHSSKAARRLDWSPTWGVPKGPTPSSRSRPSRSASLSSPNARCSFSTTQWGHASRR